MVLAQLDLLLGENEIRLGVEDIGQPPHEFLGLLPHHPVQVDQVSVGIVENLLDRAVFIQQHRAPAAEYLHIRPPPVVRGEPLVDRLKQGLLAADPG